MDVSQIIDGMQIDWSPDGTRVVFASMADRTNLPNDVLYIMDADGTGLRELAYWCYEPRWSPNGDLILCTHGGRIYVLDPNQDYTEDTNKFFSSSLQLPGGWRSSWMGHWAWSPTGKEIAISLDSGIYIINPDSSSPRCVVEDSIEDNMWISWSPDSCWIVYYDGEIKAANVVDRSQRIIAQRGGWPSWSLTTNKIAYFVSDRFRRFDDTQTLPTEIRIYDFETDKTQSIDMDKIEVNHNVICPLVWSPDSRELAFEATKLRLFRKSSTHVYILNIETKNLMQLSDGSHASDASIRWSPDGSQIALCSTADFRTRIYSVRGTQ